MLVSIHVYSLLTFFSARWGITPWYLRVHRSESVSKQHDSRVRLSRLGMHALDVLQAPRKARVRVPTAHSSSCVATPEQLLHSDTHPQFRLVEIVDVAEQLLVRLCVQAGIEHEFSARRVHRLEAVSKQHDYRGRLSRLGAQALAMRQALGKRELRYHRALLQLCCSPETTALF